MKLNDSWGDNRTLIFLHVPKTAGSTFHLILNKRYRRKNIINVFGSTYNEPRIQSFIHAPKEKKQGVDLLKGHMPYGLHQFLPENRKFGYITFLRRPADRAISLYYYIKKNSHNPLHSKVHKSGMTLMEFVQSGVALGVNNGHCRFLSGDFEKHKYNCCPENYFESIKPNIEKYFLWLGLTERFDESVLLLSLIMGWESPPYYIRENVSKVRSSKAPPSQEDLVLLDSYNYEDQKLYKYANQRLDEEISRVDGFDEMLDKYKQKNGKIQARWGWLPDSFKYYVI